MFPLDDFDHPSSGHWPAGRLAIDLLALLRPASGAKETRVRVLPRAQLTSALASDAFVGLTPSLPVSSRALHEGCLVARVVGEFFTSDRAEPLKLDLVSTAWAIDFDVVHVEDSDGLAAQCDLWVVLGLHPGAVPPRTLSLSFPSRWTVRDGHALGRAETGSAAESLQVEFR